MRSTNANTNNTANMSRFSMNSNLSKVKNPLGDSKNSQRGTLVS